MNARRAARPHEQLIVTVALAAAIAGLIVAGFVHVLLVPGHVLAQPVLGFGFLIVGIAQLVLAALLVAMPMRGLSLVALLLSTASIGAWVIDVTVGLPLASHADLHAARESMDATSLLAKSAELVTLLSSIALRRAI